MPAADPATRPTDQPIELQPRRWSFRHLQGAHRSPRGPRRRLLAGLALLLAAAAVAGALTNPFGGWAGSGGGVPGNGAATSLASVVRRSLSSQTQVSGTLGYAGSSSVNVPPGTAASDLLQAQQTAASDRAALRAAEATLGADARTLEQARATLAADRQKLASDCRGDNAVASGSAGGANGSGAGAGSGAGSGTGSGSGPGSSPCAGAAQAVASDDQTVADDEPKVTSDRGQVASARVTLAGAEQSLALAESSATVYDAAAAYTMLPAAGDVVRRGRALYAVDGRPVLLLYGPVTAWRALRAGMAAGRDVAELNANLRALGYGKAPAGGRFTSATAAAIRALQAAHGLAQTGELPLGLVVFEPGPVRVTSVTPTLGQAVQAGAVLAITTTRHQVAIELDAAQQSEVKVGDRVTVTLPDNSRTPGFVSKVGTVATTPSNNNQGNGTQGNGTPGNSDQGNGSSSTPTIEIDVRLLHPAAAGSLDQAPVQVGITTASVSDVLVVPVNALLALSGGGYAVEVVDAARVHRLVAVTTGLFDDAEGLVQVSGAELHAGQRVVVPSS
jgi:Putative peptidoglycan binding domain/HlyD family secretion protein